MRTGVWIRLPMAVVVVAVVAACSSWAPEEPSIAGWPLGPETPCEVAQASEPKYDRVAIAATSARLEEPDIADVQCYGEGTYLSNGQPFLVNRSGGVVIVVFTLTDGGQRGVGIHCLADCRTVDPPRGPSR